MKKLIYILLLISSESFGQIVVTLEGSGQTATTNVTSFSFNSGSYDAGKLYLFVAITTGTTNPGTVTSTTLTWTNVINTGDATRRIQVFRCMPTSSVTGETTTIGTFGGGSTGYSSAIYKVTGVPTTGTNGADAIVQAVADAATGANPSISTMSAISSGRNAVLAIFGTNTNPPTGTAETDWAEDRDLGYNSPTSGVYFMHRLTTTDNTPSFTAASSTWLGAAIEFKTNSRRVISAN